MGDLLFGVPVLRSPFVKPGTMIVCRDPFGGNVLIVGER